MYERLPRSACRAAATRQVMLVQDKILDSMDTGALA